MKAYSDANLIVVMAPDLLTGDRQTIVRRLQYGTSQRAGDPGAPRLPMPCRWRIAWVVPLLWLDGLCSAVLPMGLMRQHTAAAWQQMVLRWRCWAPTSTGSTQPTITRSNQRLEGLDCCLVNVIRAILFARGISLHVIG